MFFETLKANILIIIFFGAVGYVGYWGVTSLQVDPDEFDTKVTDVRPSVSNGGVNNSNNDQVTPPPISAPVATTPSAPVTQPSSQGENTELKKALQKLITDNVLMKRGSRGTRVGTVQEFLNLYNGTDSVVDNDFGPTTENQVRAFQRSEGLTADGQTGPNTYRKMIEWLDR
jgi:hypothetical protein